MIQQLLHHIRQLLATELSLEAQVGGVLPDHEQEPAAKARPSSVTLYQGKFTLNPSLRDTHTSQPRPQAMAETISINKGTLSYPFQKPPLRENVHCLVVDPAPVRTLTEGVDFEVDWANSILTLKPTFKLSTAKTLQLKYSTPGVFKLQEFEQTLWVDILADPAKPNLEETTSLLIGTLLTAHDDLIHHFNQGDPDHQLEKSAYSSPLLSTHHTLNRIDLIEGVPIRSGSNSGFRLQFKIMGQFATSRTMFTGGTLIKTIEKTGEVSKEKFQIL